MYSLVIADDEKIIREALGEFIDWESLGFRLERLFPDGRDVISYLEKNSVDVVLTDIKMNQASGLDVAKYVRENRLETKVVLISGYKDFNYAKKAIAYGVVDFILKPIENEELFECFNRLKTTLDRSIKVQQYYQDVVPMLTQQLILDIYYEALKDLEKIKDKIEKYHLELDIEKSPVCVVDIYLEDFDRFIKEKWHYEKEKLYTSLFHVIESELYEMEIIPILTENEHAKLFIYAKENCVDDLGESVRDSFEKTKKSIKSLIGLNMLFQVTSEYLSIQEMLKGSVKLDDKDRQSIISLIITHMTENEKEELENILEQYINDLAMDKDSFSISVYRLVDEIKRKIEDSNDYIDSLDVDDKQIMKMKSVRKISQHAKNIIFSICDQMQKVNSTDRLIEKAKEYIANHYHEDISREDVAKALYLNASYFSRLFKQRTGCNYSDYIASVRITESKRLLLTKEYKAYEVGEKVGYRNPKYFSKVFKQETGVTPSEYARYGDEDV